MDTQKFVQYAVDKKLIKDTPEDIRILTAIITRNVLTSLLDFLHINTEVAYDMLEAKGLLSDSSGCNPNAVRYIIRQLSAPAGLRKLTKFSDGY